jgi:hypothetical protein
MIGNRHQSWLKWGILLCAVLLLPWSSLAGVIASQLDNCQCRCCQSAHGSKCDNCGMHGKRGMSASNCVSRGMPFLANASSVTPNQQILPNFLNVVTSAPKLLIFEIFHPPKVT